MTPQDQVLYFLSAVGVVLMLGALWSVRQLDKHERAAAIEKTSKTRPAE